MLIISRPIRCSALILALVLPFFSSNALVTLADAYDFGCQEEWAGPNETNSPIECLITFPLRDFGMLVPPLIPIVLLVAFLIGFPLVFVCRILGAFGSNEIRPGADCCCDGEGWDVVDEEVKLIIYPRRYIRRVKRAAFFAFIASFVTIATVAYGMHVSLDSFDQMLVTARKDIFDWAKTMLDTIEASAKFADPNNNNELTYISPITSETFAPFRGLYDWGEGMYTMVSDGFAAYRTMFFGVAIGASVIPTLCILFILVFAFFNVRRVVPRVFQFVFYALGIVCGLLGLVLLVVGTAGVCLCGEVDLQYWQSPGMFQWWVIPMCQSQSIFGEGIATLRTMEEDNSITACREALNHCSDAAAFDPIGAPNVIFVCPGLSEATLATQCGSFAQMNATITTMAFKTGTDALCPSADCQLYADCAQHCTEETARNQTQSTLRTLQFAANATAVIDRYVPEFDCDVLMTRFLSPLHSEGHCTTLSIGLMVMGIGASFGCLVFIWGSILLCKGQKLFFNRRALISDEVIEIDVMAPEERAINKNWKKSKPPTW